MSQLLFLIFIQTLPLKINIQQNPFAFSDGSLVVQLKVGTILPSRRVAGWKIGGGGEMKSFHFVHSKNFSRLQIENCREFYILLTWSNFTAEMRRNIIIKKIWNRFSSIFLLLWLLRVVPLLPRILCLRGYSSTTAMMRNRLLYFTLSRLLGTLQKTSVVADFPWIRFFSLLLFRSQPAKKCTNPKRGNHLTRVAVRVLC